MGFIRFDQCLLYVSFFSPFLVAACSLQHNPQIQRRTRAQPICTISSIALARGTCGNEMAVNPYHVNPLDCDSVSEACPVKASIYGYYPILASNAFFAALFGTCFIINFILGWRYRSWSYMLAMCLACLSSCIGYIGRCLMHNNPFDTIGFQIQICCLTFSPALNSAALYLILKHLVLQFGREWSRIRPKWYTWAFISADIAALSMSFHRTVWAVYKAHAILRFVSMCSL